MLNGEIFATLREAKVQIEAWRRDYNAATGFRSHLAVGIPSALRCA
jgi:hypothetical protein